MSLKISREKFSVADLPYKKFSEEDLSTIDCVVLEALSKLNFRLPESEWFSFNAIHVFDLNEFDEVIYSSREKDLETIKEITEIANSIFRKESSPITLTTSDVKARFRDLLSVNILPTPSLGEIALVKPPLD